MWLSLISGISSAEPDPKPWVYGAFELGQIILPKKGRSSPRLFPEIQPNKIGESERVNDEGFFLKWLLHIIWLEENVFRSGIQLRFKINDWWKTGFESEFLPMRILTEVILSQIFASKNLQFGSSAKPPDLPLGNGMDIQVRANYDARAQKTCSGRGEKEFFYLDLLRQQNEIIVARKSDSDCKWIFSIRVKPLHYRRWKLPLPRKFTV